MADVGGYISVVGWVKPQNVSLPGSFVFAWLWVEI